MKIADFERAIKKLDVDVHIDEISLCKGQVKELYAHTKRRYLKYTGLRGMDYETVQLREEIAMQIRALNDMKIMASVYGFDISNEAIKLQEYYIHANEQCR